MTETKPCGICGSENVRVDRVPGPRRLGDAQAPMVEVRRCLNAECGSNTGAPRRLGESV